MKRPRTRAKQRFNGGRMDTETARERGRAGGKKSGETRRRKAELRADARARLAFEVEAENIAKELLDAAFGREAWMGPSGPLLDPKERAGILKLCMEYAVGRPRPWDVQPKEEPEEQKAGIAFGVRPADEGDSVQPGSPGAVRNEPA